ncbi:MAG: pyruvate kinase [bacterium]|nr:pyruvate kinase [bacterium]
MLSKRKTKIIVTIGPSSEDEAIMEKLFSVGADAARLNFSHGTLQDHSKRIKRIRAVGKKFGRHIGILGDLQGPKMRVGKLPDEGILLRDEEEVILDTSLDEYTQERIPVTSPIFEKGVDKGSQVFLDDGSILLKIISVKRVYGIATWGKRFRAKVIRGGTLYSHKGINVPDIKLRTNIFEKNDKEAIRFAIHQKLDYLAVSFVRNHKDMIEARKLLRGAPIKLLAKIERPEALQDLEKIIEHSDAVMVARGDLGIETPLWELPVKQKEIIQKSLRCLKPVVVATQMLESMTKNVIPTRAEVSDVSNAVYDSADAVMLSAESASGKHPIESVLMMRRILTETEKHTAGLKVCDDGEGFSEVSMAVAKSTKYVAREIGAEMILVGTATGYSARAVARYRPTNDLVAVTTDERVARQLSLVWGVEPIVLEKTKTVEEVEKITLTYLKKEKRLSEGDRVVFVSGQTVGTEGMTNNIRVLIV